MHQAAFRGDTDIVRILVREGADLTTGDKEGRTPLHTAIRQHNLPISRILIDAGADLSIPDADGLTPLHVALCKGKIEISRTLIQKGAGISVMCETTRAERHCLWLPGGSAPILFIF